MAYGTSNPIEARRRFRGGPQAEMVKRRRESGCTQQHRRNIAASSVCSPLSANSEKDGNSGLNLLSEEDHGRIEPLGGPSTAHRGDNRRFSSFSRRSFLLQSISKICRGGTIRNQIPISQLNIRLQMQYAQMLLTAWPVGRMVNLARI